MTAPDHFAKTELNPFAGGGRSLIAPPLSTAFRLFLSPYRGHGSLRGRKGPPVALWIAAQAFGYASGIWGTYRQWQAVGAQVRKGEHGSTVVLWKQAASSADDDHDGDEESVHRRVFARAFTVFNLAQVEGYEPEPVALLPETERFAHADAFIEALKIPVTHGAYDAHYRIDLDHIFMPMFAAFRDAAAHMATLVHECAHATGARHRLDRNFEERFRRDAVAVEECVAEPDFPRARGCPSQSRRQAQKTRYLPLHPGTNMLIHDYLEAAGTVPTTTAPSSAPFATTVPTASTRR